MKTPEKTTLTDVTELRRRARAHIEKGAVTAGYTADREVVVKLLNTALASETVCVLRSSRSSRRCASSGSNRRRFRRW